MMDRRDFVRFLAVTAAGAAALPEQIGAFEAYYDANTPLTDVPLVAVDEIWLCGIASRSIRVLADFFPGTNNQMPVAINAFGGILHWVSAPDQKVVLRRSDVRWNITTMEGVDAAPLHHILRAHISYIDQARIRRNFEIKDWKGAFA